MAIQSKNDFTKGVSLDFDELRVPPDVAVWIKDMTIGININANAASQSGLNEGVRTPAEGNVAITTPTYPSGTNYCIGTYSSEQTNELYYFLYNSTGNHTIWVIDGNVGTVTLVHENTLLPFVLDPQYFISEGRCTLELRSTTDPATGNEATYKFLIFSNNRANQFLIEVTSSIATSSFTTSYFTTTAAFYNRLELVHLGVPTPLVAIGLNAPTAYTPTSTDPTVQNLIANNGWQFRIKFIDIFGRESEHGIISSQYITIIGGGCIATSNGLPRCMMLNFDAGNPLVNQIQVEYRQWVGNDVGGALAQNWLIYEVFNKYDNSTTAEWYARGYNPVYTTTGSGITFNIGTNTIAYTFCADKNSIPIDVAETNRTEPELPRISAGVFSINKRIGLPNNLRDFNPISPSMVNQVTFGVVTPANTPCAAAPSRTITFYANIYCPYSDSSEIIRGSHGSIVFGGSDNGAGCGGAGPKVSSFTLGQVFADQANPGFIGYLAGTPYNCVSTQGDLVIGGTKVFTFVGYGGGIGGLFPNSTMQQFVITDVPAGKYIIRIASHKAKSSDPDYQKTSTYVLGTVPISDVRTPGARLTDSYSNPIKEIEVDCSGGDVILNNSTDLMFIIADLGDSSTGSAVDGYLYDCPGGSPVEMNPVEIFGRVSFGLRTDGYGSVFTDHNGFYFCTSNAYAAAQFWTDYCDGAGLVSLPSLFMFAGGSGSIQHGNGSGSITGHCFGDDGDWTPYGAIYLSPISYPEVARRRVIQFIGDCANHVVGVPGIPVVMTKGGSALSNTSGIVTIIAHNRYSYASFTGVYLFALVPDYSTSPKNIDSLIFSQKGGCQWTTCTGCVTSMADVPITYIVCSGSSIGCTITPVFPRTFCCTNIFAIPVGSGISGCQTGGKYPVAFWLHDVIGRHTAPQVLQGQTAFVTMPNLNDPGYQIFALPQIGVTIGSGFAVDPMFTKMTILVGSNILFSDFIDWAADWVQFIDNTGELNSVNPTAIRIYYGSLNEYNKQNNFTTNSTWKFGNTSPAGGPPVQGDVVQFIMNGDGTWLPSLQALPVSYDDNGLFFIISYIPELAVLKNNCLFRIIRPVQNQSGEFSPLYEQALTIPLVNGIPTILSATVPYFDSYILSRSVPLPRMMQTGGKPQPGPVPPSLFPATLFPLVYTSSNQNSVLDGGGYSTSNIDNMNGVIAWSVIDDQVSYPFLFESPSPSDLWGSHIACRGRVGVPDPYEEQQRSGTEVALSDALGDRGTFNGLSYFESQNVQTFDRNTWGNITAIMVETGVCLVICETDRFTVEFNQSQLKVSADGTVLAQNAQGIFTSPQRKVGQSFGCIPANINTIQKYGGVVAWVDNKGHIIFDTFTASTPTETQGYMGYLLNKLATVNILNQNQTANGLTYFVGCIDPKSMKYIVTSFNIPHSGSPSYGNTTTGPNLPANETYVFDLRTGIMDNAASFTPEYYGRFPGYFLQRNYISFKNGKPYSHHNTSINGITPPLFANYFGVQYLPRVTFVVNVEPERVKRYFYMEVYVKETMPASGGGFPTSLFLADVITTESLQASRILTPLWIVRDGYSASAFICDLSTPADPNLPVQTGANVARDGNPLIGRWCKISLVPQAGYAGTYFELSGTKVYINGVQQPNQEK